METTNATDVTIRRTRFAAAIVADVERRNGTKTVQDKVSPDDFLNEYELTATEKAKLLTIHTDVTARLTNMKRDSFHIGELLHKAKKILPHGKFIPWIKCFFANNLPYSTAFLYMRVYQVFQDRPESVDYFPSKCLLIMTQKDFPVKVLNYIKENADKFDKSALKHVGEVYKLWKKGKIGGSKFLRLAKEQIKIGVDIARKSTRHRINTITRMSFELGARDILERIRGLIEMALKMAGVHPPDPTSQGHRQLIEDIDKTVEALLKFKSVVEGRDKMFRVESTESGDTVNFKSLIIRDFGGAFTPVKAGCPKQ